jgi:diguanylate cyclase (GGDEF)-like protein/PAS domain S-box-containing protein
MTTSVQGPVPVLADHLCIVDAQGVLYSTDEAWREFAAAGYAGPVEVCTGHNYLVGCNENTGHCAKHAIAFASGVCNVLAGRAANFTLEYSFQARASQRWLEARIARLPGNHRQFVITHREIGEPHRSDQELQRARSLLSVTEDAIVIVDPVTLTIVDGNDAATNMLGYEGSKLSDVALDSLFAADGSDGTPGYASLLTALPNATPSEAVLRRADGSRVATEVRPRDVMLGDRSLVALLIRDIGDRRRVEALLRRQALQHHLLAQFGQLALENPPLDVLALRATDILRSGLDVELCRILMADAEQQHLTQIAGAGWDESSIQQTAAQDASAPSAHLVSGSREAVIVQDLRSGSRYQATPILSAHEVRSAVEVLICGKEGLYGLIGAYARDPGCFDTDSANFLHSIANTLAAAIDRGRGEVQLTRLAQFDSLTGLPNRSLYLDRLAQTLVESERDRRPVAVLFVDIDHFKYVNDTLGHAVGDQLLVQIADRLKAEIRPGDTVGRLGGDEFTVTLAHLGHDDDAGAVAKRMVTSLGAPYRLGEHVVHVSASIGVSLYPNDGGDASTLLKCADTAMYRAKESGRSTYRFYLPKMNERAVARMKLEGQLRGALQRGEYQVHYQPRVSVATGGINGLEALLHWRPAEHHSLMTPDEFLPVLEETGLIIPVGEWVVATVCEQIGRWRKEGFRPLPVALNLSARQFRYIDIDGVIGAILASTGTDPQLLEVELKEYSLMRDSDAAIQSLHALKQRGIRVAVDNFGTGLSSLMYLKRFPLDYLKIDRSFIHDISTNPESAQIAIAIINLAHSLRLRVVAVGVETRAQLDFLRANGCDDMQGDYYCKAQPADQLVEALRSERRLLFADAIELASGA